LLKKNMRENKKGNGNTLITLGVGVAILSAAAFLWGASYTNNLQNVAYAGLSSLTGQQDSTYGMAKMAVSFSPIGFLAGVVLCIVGFIRR
jgi:hypothetical protein